MSARTLTNVVNDQTVALNALIYGYAGHSLVTPQHALQHIWWTEERINDKVTNEFVSSRLQPQERERLHHPVGFGDLSDDTYIEWIMEKARRLFLILVEIGIGLTALKGVERAIDVALVDVYLHNMMHLTQRCGGLIRRERLWGFSSKHRYGGIRRIRFNGTVGLR